VKFGITLIKDDIERAFGDKIEFDEVKKSEEISL
jgi:hypothetical protein